MGRDVTTSEMQQSQPSRPPHFLRITPQQIAACSFDRWYSKFRTSVKDKHTFHSVHIELEDRFVQYLKQDGIRLPKPPKDMALLKARDPRKTTSIKKDDDDDDSWADGDDTDDEGQEEPFTSLEQQIETAIEQLGGEVFPKLNWSSPRDAAWMGGGTLACATPGEIFLLLKSSDFCHSDLRNMKKVETASVLALRKHLQLNPALEFRCYVRNNRLLFACQRDPSRFYAFLNESEMQEKLLANVKRFIEQLFVPRFETGGGSGFVADVYVEITSRKPEGKCWLVDVAPLPDRLNVTVETTADDLKTSETLFATPPHPLLEWEELFDIGESDPPRLLVVTDRRLTDSSEQKVLAMHRVPLDLVHGALTSEMFEEGFSKLRATKDDADPNDE